jgi:hypothetical protein
MPPQLNVYVAAVKGAHITTTPEKAGLWLISGEGQTAGPRTRRPLGTDVIDLEKVTWYGDNSYTEFAPRTLCRIISPCHFVATAINEPNAIMSVKFQITQIPLDPGFFLTHLEGNPANTASHINDGYKQIKVTVTSNVNGQPKGLITYNWMCLVKVGILWEPRG